MNKKIIIAVSLIIVMGLTLVGCGGSETETDPNAPDAKTSVGIHASVQHEVDSPEWVKKLPAAASANQLFVVAGMGMDKTTGFVTMHKKDSSGNWKQILSSPCYVGENGLCPDAQYKEGVKQTPIGTYKFNKAFGVGEDIGCAIPYTKVNENTYICRDVNDSHYNQFIDITQTPNVNKDECVNIYEREYDFQYCLNISFNEECTPGRGSAIFLRCLGQEKPYTGGCVAVPENIMQLIMKNVDKDCVVVIDTMENLGAELQ